MAQVNQQAEPETANPIVETNNMFQVLEHFDSAGDLKHKPTYFEIECQICLLKNLPLMQLEQKKPAPEMHREFSIIPGCGHVFGEECLESWMEQQGDIVSTCPSCRRFIYCEKGHGGMVWIFKNSTPTEIKEIRDILRKPRCKTCATKDEKPRGRIASSAADMPLVASSAADLPLVAPLSNGRRVASQNLKQALLFTIGVGLIGLVTKLPNIKST